MKTLASIMMALLLACGLAVPVMAHDEKVTQTFELTVSGTPPADQGIFVAYIEKGGDSRGERVLLCGDTSIVSEKVAPILEGVKAIVSNKACEGNGTVYTHKVEFAHDTAIAVTFVRVSLTNLEQGHIISSTGLDDQGNPTSYQVLDEDKVNRASYDFSQTNLLDISSYFSTEMLWGSLTVLVVLAAGVSVMVRRQRLRSNVG